MSKRLLVIGVAFLVALCTTVWADTPLYELDPYDQITLDAANKNAVLKVRPLDLPDEQLPVRPKSSGRLLVRLIDSPDKEYEVAWRSIAKFESFDQLILNKAKDLAAQRKFDEAYDYFFFLERNRPSTPGLGEAIEDSLYEEAKQTHRQQDYDGSLALLRELHRRNPNRPQLDQALGRTTDVLVDRYVRETDFVAARTLLQNLATASPKHPVVSQWTDRLTDRAAPLLDQARTANDAGQFGKAAELVRQSLAIWPQLAGARELAESIQQEHPRVVVGVGTLAASVTPGRLDDWASRRASRLLYRTLTEFAGPSAEGGEYVCPVGRISSETLARRLAIELRPGIRWAQGDATLTNSDISRRLLAMADPHDPAYTVDWSDLLAAVSLNGVYGLDVELRRPHVRPEAMLRIVLTPYSTSLGSSESLPTNGPFVLQSRTPEETVFSANAQYFAAEPGGLMELVERRFASSTQAVLALRRGEIQVLDRVNPWTLASLQADSRLIVGPYALPLIHCLIPNVRRPLLRDRTFRRALVYGIQRHAILRQMLGGQDIQGCEVTSSPFLVPVGVNDPMGYASDPNIEPSPYDPRLAIALANVALDSYRASQEKQNENQDKQPASMPKLVLAHPAHEIAHTACLSIRKQLQLLGIPVELRPLENPLPMQIPDDVDLLYAELAMWEPTVDARRVLGQSGIGGRCSPYMSHALRQLDEAADWQQVRACLHRIHRSAHDDVAIIPLWQLTEHFACREGLLGIVASPVCLYQNVEQWRPAFLDPPKE